MENDEYLRMIERLTAVSDADLLSALFEEDARRFDRSYSQEREAGQS